MNKVDNSVMDGNDILRSRIEEQSNLIVSLKQQNVFKDQIYKDTKRFEILEQRFDHLAKYNEETIRVKDEYKTRVEKLTLENTNLKNELNAKESQKIIDFYNEIESLNKKLQIESNLNEELQQNNKKLIKDEIILKENFSNLTAKFNNLVMNHEKLVKATDEEILKLTKNFENLKETSTETIKQKTFEIKD